MKIGIDLGGSHIGIGIVENGNIIEKIETDIISEINQNDKDTEKQKIENRNTTQEIRKEKIQNYILENIEKLLKKYPIEEIGIAVPGTVKDGKITSLVNLEIKEWDLQKMIRKQI